MRSLVPILTVLAVMVAIWYAGAVYLNADWAHQQAARQDRVLSTSQLIAETWSQDRPRLPAPHQVATEIWETTVEKKITSKRSLIYHGWVTLSVTLAGFGFGATLGIALAIGIVYSRAMDMSVMPWVIASQTIPILAIAPMIIVVLNSVGMQGFIPKAIIATYLSFFPVTVGMVKGLRAPSGMQLDQMKTWNASGLQGFIQLRLPSSLPYLFTSLKIAVAASLVGTVIGELPTGAVAGLGARLLAGSYYGQTVQIWSALFGAAALAALLIVAVGLIERIVTKRMGFGR